MFIHQEYMTLIFTKGMMAQSQCIPPNISNVSARVSTIMVHNYEKNVFKDQETKRLLKNDNKTS